MANELTVSASLSYSKDAVVESISLSKQADITSGLRAKASQTVGTSEEQFSLVDVASPRYVIIQNLDDTNFVQVGTATGEYAIKLLPGDIALFPPNATALYLKADTAACLVDITAVNA
jgi:hypothetical protein